MLANWQRWNGSSWVAPLEYPGQVVIPGWVDINNDITLDLSPPRPIGDLYINSGTLELSSYNFIVNGATNIEAYLVITIAVVL